MFPNGSVSRALRLLPLMAPAALCAAALCPGAARAQVQSIPAPVPAAPGSFPSISAPVPAGTPVPTLTTPITVKPSATPAPAAPANEPTLTTPITVNPSTAPAPAAPANQPSLTSPITVQMPAAPQAPAAAAPTPAVPAAPVPAMAAPAATAPSPAPPTPYTDPLHAPLTIDPYQVQSPTSFAPPTPLAHASLPSEPAYNLDFGEETVKIDELGSVYIPVDSPVYPMVLRLYSLGYLDTIFLSLRPYTTRSLLHALQKTQPDVMAEGNEEAQQIFARLMTILSPEVVAKNFNRGRVYGVGEVYTRLLGIGGTTLNDSYHLGQTIFNDYGRPYAGGLNNITGASSTNEWGRFSLYVRGEYQHSPSFAGYSLALAQQLSALDGIPFNAPNSMQATIPYGRYTLGQDTFALQEANLSFHTAGHEISFGKSDAWLGPGYGSGQAWSNNAQDIYSFRINRVEPLHIPYLSALLGPVRYDFFVGSLKGHTFVNDPWVHSEAFSFAPTANFQFGFQRTVIWGGKAHEPITIHTFLKSFFSYQDTTAAEKNSAEDPGARFSAFNFSWRLPFLHHYVTLYTDSETHDDVFPISAPRRAAYRPGVYLSQFPHLPRLDLRVEGTSTDGSTLRSLNGVSNYFESIQKQGYTNKGFIMGDWIGREAKGGQAWLTYHLSAEDWVQLSYLHKKQPQDFIASGTSQSQFKIDVVKRLPHGVLLDAWYQYESWTAPIYQAGKHSTNSIAAQFTYYPKLHVSPTVK